MTWQGAVQAVAQITGFIPKWAARRPLSGLLALLVVALVALAIVPAAEAGCADTAWLLLCKPAEGDLDWDTNLNANFDKIDDLASGITPHRAVGLRRGPGLSPPTTGEMRLWIDESADRGLGTATADCALVGRLSNGTDIVIDILVVDAPCP